MTDVNKINLIDTGDIEKINNIDSGNINKLGGITVKFSVIPIGLIIPFNTASLPSGWSRFSEADDKLLIGAGGSYNPGDNSTGSSVSGTALSSAGAHNGLGYVQDANIYAEFYQWYTHTRVNPTQPGSHTHNISGQYTPQRVNIVLGKADIEHSEFPQNAMVFAKDDLSSLGLSNYYTDDRFIYGSSSVSQTGKVSNISVASGGTHTHITTALGRDTSTGATVYNYVSAGAHTHSNISTSYISDNLRKLYLSTWTNASAAFSIETNMIGMYESLTPPDGWVLCDGNNNTPDMRNYFVVSSSVAKHGTTAGSANSLTISSHSVSGSPVHDHHGGVVSQSWGYRERHASWAWSHSHTCSGTFSWLPPYYALSFIMKAA